LVSLGCPKNQVDSEVMLGILRKEGFEPVQDFETAEVVVINTCGFIDAAKEESIQTILEHADLKKTGNCRVLIAAGCLSQRYPDALLKDIPELDAVVGTGDFPKIAEISRSLLSQGSGRKALSRTGEPTFLYRPETPRNRLSPEHWAYVKISEGCNYRCSFCAIPSFRGDLVSRPEDEIVSEVRDLAAEGVREINLIAQSLTSYGVDRKEKDALISLLEKLIEIEGPRWFRLFYTYPTDLSDSLLDLIAREPRLCNYVDLPLQHIHDFMLRAMNRKGSSKEVRALIQRIRERVPGAALRSTFIVGFPGETEAQFEELARFIEETRFDRLGVFTYSHEDQTSAVTLIDSVPKAVKEERQRRLLEIQEKIQTEKHEALVGSVHEVMVEGPSEEAEWNSESRMEGQAPEIDGVVYLEGEARQAGEFINVEITEALGADLVAWPLVSS
ncbi:MAG TPA: 30S ribosomal protein S12 methylthiotransferase RimO, partial [Nitrospiria bacterium]|nr:30S ribosomal protein S12 methylthiotransferase RimO [Nitrospiria bacterium]